MIQRWNESPIWQRFVILGLAAALLVLGINSGGWNSLDQSMARITQDVADLNQKNQESIQSIVLLKGMEQELSLLRKKLATIPQHAPVGVEPQAFRREIMNIGKQMGVSVRLWKPQKRLIENETSDTSLDIIVRVEGSFYSTVQFLDGLLELSWVQTVDPLVLIRKQDVNNSSLVTTDFTIKGVASQFFLRTKETQKT